MGVKKPFGQNDGRVVSAYDDVHETMMLDLFPKVEGFGETASPIYLGKDEKAFVSDGFGHSFELRNVVAWRTISDHQGNLLRIEFVRDREMGDASLSSMNHRHESWKYDGVVLEAPDKKIGAHGDFGVLLSSQSVPHFWKTLSGFSADMRTWPRKLKEEILRKVDEQMAKSTHRNGGVALAMFLLFGLSLFLMAFLADFLKGVHVVTLGVLFAMLSAPVGFATTFAWLRMALRCLRPSKIHLGLPGGEVFGIVEGPSPNSCRIFSTAMLVSGAVLLSTGFIYVLRHTTETSSFYGVLLGLAAGSIAGSFFESRHRPGRRALFVVNDCAEEYFSFYQRSTYVANTPDGEEYQSIVRAEDCICDFICRTDTQGYPDPKEGIDPSIFGDSYKVK